MLQCSMQTGADAVRSNNRLNDTPMNRPAHFSTKDRILGAAEELFAQHGFAGTSLRQVTSQADVNIAAVNYHFGSKENLVNEVFRRRMDEMTATAWPVWSGPPRLPRRPGSGAGRLRRAGLAMAQDRNGGGAFVRVIARAYAEKNDACASSCPTTTATSCANSANPSPLACPN
jgi:AcrR family transcriptional regulator